MPISSYSIIPKSETTIIYPKSKRKVVLNSKSQIISKDYLILAKEIGEHYPVIGDIDDDQKDHWSARAIRNKLTTLKDDNELTDFLAKTNNSTFGMFKVYSSQQFSPRFYVFRIIKKEWL